MAVTRKYNNGSNGWTDYDDKGNAVGAGTYNAPGTARNPFNADPNAQIKGYNGGTNSGEGSLWDNSTGQKVSSGSSSSSSYTQSAPQKTYQDALAEYQSMLAEQKANAQKDALRQAWEGNSQALNSQKSTVANNYNSASNKLNAVRDARLPEFQQQRNSASADAAQTAMRLKEIMAATGRGDSGYSRSNQTAVDLNRSNALSALTGSENQFKTDVSNQLSDVDAQRVSALNDIASKLQLGEKQFNDGTLSLTNQLESEKASGALQAFLEAQQRADTLAQQQFNNSFQEKQFEQNASLAELQQQWQQKQFEAEQSAQQWQQQFQQQGFSADEAWRLSQLKLQQDTLAAEQAYKAAALAKSGSSGGSSSANLSAVKYQNEQSSQQALASSMQGLQKMASNGSTRSDILKFINENAGDLQANGVPIQDLYGWASKNFTWDKNGGEWYNTADDD